MLVRRAALVLEGALANLPGPVWATRWTPAVPAAPAVAAVAVIVIERTFGSSAAAAVVSVVAAAAAAAAVISARLPPAEAGKVVDSVAAIDLVAESFCLPISTVAGTTGGRSAARAVRALPPTFAAAAVAAAAAVVSSIRLPHAEAGSVVDAAGVMGLVAVPCMDTALAPAAVATLVAIVHSGVAGGSAVAGCWGSPVATVAGITDGVAAASAVLGLPPGAGVRRTLSVAAATSAAGRRTLTVVAVVVAAVAGTAVAAAAPWP